MSSSRFQKSRIRCSDHHCCASSSSVSEMLFTVALQLEAKSRGTNSASHVRVLVHAWVEVGLRLTVILGSRPRFTQLRKALHSASTYAQSSAVARFRQGQPSARVFRRQRHLREAAKSQASEWTCQIPYRKHCFRSRCARFPTENEGSGSSQMPRNANGNTIIC